MQNFSNWILTLKTKSKLIACEDACTLFCSFFALPYFGNAIKAGIDCVLETTTKGFFHYLTFARVFWWTDQVSARKSLKSPWLDCTFISLLESLHVDTCINNYASNLFNSRCYLSWLALTWGILSFGTLRCSNLNSYWQSSWCSLDNLDSAHTKICYLYHFLQLLWICMVPQILRLQPFKFTTRTSTVKIGGIIKELCYLLSIMNLSKFW